MIKRISIENLGPIKNKVEISMEKGKTEQYPENIIPDSNILKTIYIYGANNSGKSKILDSLKLLNDITNLGKELFYSDEGTKYFPNFFKEVNDYDENEQMGFFDTKLEYEFIFENKNYKYRLEFDFRKKEIKKEEFFVENIEVFKRKKEIKIENLKIELEKDIFAISYLATQSGKYEEINNFYNYLKNIIFIDQQRDSYSSVKKNSRNIEKIEFLKNNEKKINRLIEEFGFDFTLSVREKKEKFGYEEKMITVIKNAIDAPLDLIESFGTNIFIDLLLTVEAQENNEGLIVIDEIERGIHYGLVSKFIKYINENYPKKQLILATHMTDLLESELNIRKDQVYITEIEDYEFSIKRAFNKKAIRETMNFQKVLKSGAIGGLPNFPNEETQKKS